MKHISTKDYAKKLGVSQSRIVKLINQGRIKASKLGSVWAIPANTKDPRKNIGRPRK